MCCEQISMSTTYIEFHSCIRLRNTSLDSLTSKRLRERWNQLGSWEMKKKERSCRWNTFIWNITLIKTFINYICLVGFLRLPFNSVCCWAHIWYSQAPLLSLTSIHIIWETSKAKLVRNPIFSVKIAIISIMLASIDFCPLQIGKKVATPPYKIRLRPSDFRILCSLKLAKLALFFFGNNIGFSQNLHCSDFICYSPAASGISASTRFGGGEMARKLL